MSVSAYRARLSDARALLRTARAAPAETRADLVARARELLARTTVIRSGDAEIAVRDVVAVAGATDGDLDRALADLEPLLGSAARAESAPFDAGRADEARDRALAATERSPGGVPLLQGLFSFLFDQIVRLLSGLPGISEVFSSVPRALVAAGLLLLVALVALLARGLPDRFRAEVEDTHDAARAAPAEATEHLQRADAAAARGGRREALHELYLFALRSLGERGILRFDPSLTDRELLARAAPMRAAGELRELVHMHDRAWYGLRTPPAEELRHARDLAQRIAA